MRKCIPQNKKKKRNSIWIGGGMATHPSLIPEIGPDGLAREAPIIAYTEKIIAEEQLQLKKYIEENYSKIRDVERELANLTLELKLTAGPKKAALEHLRKKIELQTERIRAAKLKEDQARKCHWPEFRSKVEALNARESRNVSLHSVSRCRISHVWEVAVKALQDEEEIKQKLCDDLKNLVQESTNTQFSRLEELKRRLAALNPSRASSCDFPDGRAGQQAHGNKAVSDTASNASTAELAGCMPESLSNYGKDGASLDPNGHSQSPAVDSEARGKKKNVNLGRGRGNMFVARGRGSHGQGWTGAGFDVDGRT